MIRFILCVVVVAGFLILSIPILLAEWIVGKFSPMAKEIDTLILGCTHYPLLRSTIGQVMGEGVRLVNPAYETALELGRLLKEQDLLSTGKQQEEFPYRFYVSDLADKFKEFANSILPYDVEMTQKIDIEKY